MLLPTVKIKADVEGGFLILNESDFNASVHVLFKEEQDVPLPKEEPKTAATPRRGRPRKDGQG